MIPRSSWRRLLAITLAGCALVLPSCANWDGHFRLLGYSTQPNYDTSIKTIRVPIFANRTYWSVIPTVGMEMDLTRAVVKAIEQITPYKVVQGDADSELRGIIVSMTKVPLNYNQQNTVREAQMQMTVSLIWRDLRTGKILSNLPRRPGALPPFDPRQPLLATNDSIFPPGTKPVPIGGVPILPGTEAGQNEEEPIVDPSTKMPPVPVIVNAVGYFRPELGESTTTGIQMTIDNMAVQIVSAMEKPW